MALSFPSGIVRHMPSPALAQASATSPLRAYSLVVRITHWTNTAAICALIVSGVAILLAHPRLYWGETGGFGSPALITLPLPLEFDQSGWGRSLHFLAAWVCVLNGIVYATSGLASKHFAARMVQPARKRSPSSGAQLSQPDSDTLEPYSRVQAATYLAVIFVLLPLAILTGLSLSPAVMAAVPIVALFGGHQSARTIHFFASVALVVFFGGHLLMVSRGGFLRRMRRMITG
jgi:thiosulfate reductase cytochrome b subunit